MSDLVALVRRLADAVDALEFAPPVAYVYNPLAYAREPLERYLERFPAAKQWFEFTDFTLFRFTIARARYVGGFANAHTLRADDLRQAAGMAP